ncbi:PLP-dependent cysteine synthase family protein [Nocardia sp. NPDC004860]|uniref:PLP-dependent cysteine synthase family protein n=1 Tax=Nocardia sp. NPDC004860 TaxID=3154557 RepID=UPI0033BC5756
MDKGLLDDFDTITGHPGLPGLAREPRALVGNTPVLWVGEPFAPPGLGFWAKLEGRNPGGMKDRPALHMVRRARERGVLAPGGRIIESSSGTLGLGLALAGLVYRHPVTVVTDPGLEPMVAQLLAAYGAHVELVSEPHPAGGWQQARRDRVAELLAAEPGAWCPDQYSNPDNVDGYESLARELIEQLGGVDVLVCAVGTGGHSAGVARALRRTNPDLSLIGVDTVASSIFGQQAGPRLMRGLGSSIHPRNVNYAAFTEIHWVAPAEAVWACRTLAAAYLTSGGWSVGAVALVAGWAARTHAPGTRIAAVFPDGPHRYFDTIYNDSYCAAHGLLGAPRPTAPDTIAHPRDRQVETWTRCSTVIDPRASERVSETGAGDGAPALIANTVGPIPGRGPGGGAAGGSTAVGPGDGEPVGNPVLGSASARDVAEPLS